MARGPGGRSVGRIGVRVVPDSSKFSEDLKVTLERAERTHRLRLRVDIDQTRLRAQLRQAAQQVTVPLRLDRDQALRDFARLWRSFREYARLFPIPVHFDLDSDAFEARLRTLLRPRRMTVTMDSRGDRGGTLSQLLRMPARALGGLVDGLGNLGKVASVAALAMAGVSTALLATLQLTGGVTLALSQIAGLVAFLPALGLAGVAGVGALALAFTGLKDATGPAARVRDVVVGLKDEFQSLRSTVQDNFFSLLVDPLRELGANWIPLLDNGLGNVAGQLGRVAVEILAVVNSQQSLIDGQTGLFNTTVLFAQIAVAAGFLTQAFRDLAVVGSGFFPAFGAGLAGVSQRFAEFIAQARADGSLERYMRTAIDATASFGRSIRNVADIFSQLFAAADVTGGGFLGTLEQVTGLFSTMLARPEVQAGLSSFFTSTQAGVDALLGALGTVLPGVLAAVGPLLGTVTQTLGEVLGAAVSAIGPVIQTLAPAFTSLATALGPALIGFFAALAPSLQAVAGAMVPVLDAFAQVLPPLLAALAPVLAQLATAAAGAFAELAVGVIPALGDMLLELLPVVKELIPVLADMAGQFIDQLLPVLPQIVEALANGAPYWIQLVQLAAALAPVILAVTGAVLGAIGAYLEWINTNELAQRTLLATQFGAIALTTYTKLLIAVVRSVASTYSTAFSIAADAVQAFRNKTVARFAEVLADVRSLPGRITGALGALGNLLVGKGRELIQGLLDGIRDRLGAIRSVMSEVASTIGGFLPGSPVKTGPLTKWNRGQAGAKLVDLLIGGLESRTPAVKAAMLGLTSAGAVPKLAGAAIAGGGQAAAGAAFPDQVALVDASGALLGLMDVRISRSEDKVARAVASGRRR